MRDRWTAPASIVLAATITLAVAFDQPALSVTFAAAGPAATTPGAKGCSPQLHSYFASDFKDADYQKKMFQQVASAWKRPKESPAAGAKAVVITSIAASGAASTPALHMKSGSDVWDAAALAAVKAAAPFDPLPKSYAHPSVEVHFHFECAPPDAPRTGA
jgi:outer membrane biosynthesis protein TonB